MSSTWGRPKRRLFIAGLTALISPTAATEEYVHSLDQPVGEGETQGELKLYSQASNPKSKPPSALFLTLPQTQKLVDEYGTLEGFTGDLEGAQAFTLTPTHLYNLAPTSKESDRKNITVFLRTRNVLGMRGQKFILVPGISSSTLQATLEACRDTDTDSVFAALTALLPPPTAFKRAQSRQTSKAHAERGKRKKQRALDGTSIASSPPTTAPTSLPFLHPSTTHVTTTSSVNTPMFDRNIMAEALSKTQVMLVTSAVMESLSKSDQSFLPPLISAPVTWAASTEEHDKIPTSTLISQLITPSISVGDLYPLTTHLQLLLSQQDVSLQALFKLLSPSSVSSAWEVGSAFSSILVPIYVDCSWSLAVLTSTPEQDASYMLTEYIPVAGSEAGSERIHIDDDRVVRGHPPPNTLKTPSNTASNAGSTQHYDDVLTLLYLMGVAANNTDVLTGSGRWTHLRRPVISDGGADPSSLSYIRSVLISLLGLGVCEEQCEEVMGAEDDLEDESSSSALSASSVVTEEEGSSDEDPVIVGLENLGFTCYLNTALQTLAALTGFSELVANVAAMLDSLRGRGGSGGPGLSRRQTVALLEKLSVTLGAMRAPPSTSLSSALSTNPHSHSPKALLDALPHPFAETGQQQDPTELIVALFASLSSALQALQAPQAPQASTLMRTFLELFKIRTEIRNTCSSCRTTTTSTSSVFILSLPVCGSLSECIDAAFREEVLDGQDAFACSVCGDHTRARRTTVLASPPPRHLLLSLTRFSNELEKVSTPVNLPASLLICDRTYVLRAVIVHKGRTLEDGHYTAFINAGRVGEASSWFEADDDKVSPLGSSFPTLFSAGATGVAAGVQNEDHDDPTPYLLAYSRVTSAGGREEPEPEPSSSSRRREGKGRKRKRRGTDEVAGTSQA